MMPHQTGNEAQELFNSDHIQWPFVSIVILNYNGRKFLQRCLDSVLESDYPGFEVILIDNGSTDGSAEQASGFRSSRPQVRIIFNHRNVGIAGGNNQGAMEAKGEFIVFLHNDTFTDRGWLKPLIRALMLDPTVAVAHGKLLLMKDEKKLDFAGGFLDRYGFGLNRGQHEVDNGQYDSSQKVFYAVSCAMAVKKSFFRKIGSFDKNFFNHSEDVDFCWRVWLSGSTVLFVPNSVTHHFAGGGTRQHTPSTILFHSSKNHIAMLIKNYERSNLLRYVPICTVSVLGMGAYLFVHFKGKLALSCINAILWNLSNLPKTWAQRLVVQGSVRKIPDKFVPNRANWLLHRARTIAKRTVSD